jgi:hypothetical protein
MTINQLEWFLFSFLFPGAGAHLFFPQLILHWRWQLWLFFKHSNTVVAMLSHFLLISHLPKHSQPCH